MFTRTSNFTYGNYRIANIDAASINNNIEIKIYIQKYEEQILRFLLGDSTYEDFLTKLELENGYYKIKTAEQNTVWDWLLNGKKYTANNDELSICGCGCGNNDDQRYWKGLVKKVAQIDNKDVYETMMAPYVYFHWSLNNRTLNLGTGEGKIESKNTTQESTKAKRVDAWNELVQWAAYGYSCTNVSLSQFLAHFKEDFPKVNPIVMETMNYYDL